MSIAEIGYNFNGTTRVMYDSNVSVIDYDAVLIDTKSIFEGHHQYKWELYQKRRLGLEEFVFHKNIPLIFFTGEPESAYFSRTSGGLTARINHLLPVGDFKLEPESGHKISIVQNTAFSGFLMKYGQYFDYVSIFTNVKGTVIAETPHTKKILGFYNDFAVFLPHLKSIPTNIQVEFLEELIQAARQLKTKEHKQPQPEWAATLFLPNEQALHDELSSVNNQIELLKLKLIETENALGKFADRKILLTGTGDNLESEVEKIFRQLGFEILASERNRDDLIITYNGQTAVVEIKGVAGSAAERHAAQLEKWVADYFERNEVKAKGVLLVNPYKDLPPHERTEPAFPSQMVPYSTRREHCLLTTIQLLNLYYYVQDNPNDKEEMIQTLFKTNGVYTKFQEWDAYIKNLDEQLQPNLAINTSIQ